MASGIYRWTPQRLAELRKLYEGGVSFSDLGARFGVKPNTIGVMGAKRHWKRPPAAGSVAAALAPSPSDAALNAKIANMVADYWRKLGRPIEVRLEGMGIRSRSINGMPISARDAKRLGLEGWS